MFKVQLNRDQREPFIAFSTNEAGKRIRTSSSLSKHSSSSTRCELNQPEGKHIKLVFAFSFFLKKERTATFTLLRHSISTTAAQRKRSKAKNLKTSTCLKHVQDCATRLIVKGRYNLITLIPRELHWLPVDQLILFFIYKAFHHLTPLYIQYNDMPREPRNYASVN